MGKHLIIGLLAIAPLTFALELGEELTVLADKGGTATSTYYRSGTKPTTDKGSKAAVQAGKYMTNIFPVRTASMSPGRVGPDEMPEVPPSYVMTNPVFIIGDDALSLDWLQRNRTFLEEQSAVGLVVNVETAERMNAIRKLAGQGIKISISPGDGLSEALGIKHYPFYLGKDGVMR